ncbi:hypothetical protein [Streptomyces sp. WAC 04229]|uniref:hypothetical protein n=1 Tax=Streptomyces sp. WAC 04229 TaxID=2203206 RepID=UPI0021AD5BA0|nr:hypothetical protein [Streptomyces sp. WAC 04229]
MDIPRRLVELQLAVEAAENRYRNNSGDNATIALAVWSDATAALVRGITALSEETGVPRRELERAVERAARPLAPALPPAPRPAGAKRGRHAAVSDG